MQNLQLYFQMIGYASKRIHPPAAIHLITELEILGLCVNVSQFKPIYKY